MLGAFLALAIAASDTLTPAEIVAHAKTSSTGSPWQAHVPRTTCDHWLMRATVAGEEAERRLTSCEGKEAGCRAELSGRPSVTPEWVPWAIAGSAVAGAIVGALASIAIVNAVQPSAH